MSDTPLRKLEQLIKAAPDPTEPTAEQEALQAQGDDPNTPVTNLTTADLIESQIITGHELANTITSDEILRQRHLDELRDEYIPKLYIMMLAWLCFVAVCIIAVGIGWLTLADAVLIALITTTTATVLGIFIIVAKWLFPSK
jgi:hypothetical protein